MGNLVVCANCSNQFNSNNYYSCPKCKTRVEPIEVNRTVTSNSDEKNQELITTWEKLSPQDKLLIQAQNRTTQAVRSLAITFVAAPIISIALALGMAFSIASGETGLIILTAVTALIFCMYLLVTAVTALTKSKVPTYLE